MPTNIQTLKRFNNNNIFIETGAYIGDGIQLAHDAGFKQIISIEIAPQFVEKCNARFKGNNNIKLVLGDSADVLWDVIKDINEPITFWLDGHYSGGNLPTGKYLSPLIQELETIKQHQIKSHTILIDDVRCWRDMNNIYHNNFNVSTLTQKILEINPNYKIEFIDGIQTFGEVLPKDILTATI